MRKPAAGEYPVILVIIRFFPFDRILRGFNLVKKIMNTPGTASKICLFCDKPLRGRIDKKFCDDYCRSNYNHKLNSYASPVIRKINNALKKNRRILEEMSSREGVTTKVTKQKLIEKAFQFTYYTHTYTNKKGMVYYFCYEYGYLPLENDMFLIVKRNEK